MGLDVVLIIAAFGVHSVNHRESGRTEPFGLLLPRMLFVGLAGVLLPLVAYPILRRAGRLARADAA